MVVLMGLCALVVRGIVRAEHSEEPSDRTLRAQTIKSPADTP